MVLLTVWMADDFDDLSLSSRADLAVYPLAEVEGEGEQFPSPTFISNAVVPEWTPCERTVRVHAIPNETPGGMCIHGQKERYKQMMRIPKRLVTLLSYLRMRRGEYEQHAQQHDMPSDAASLRVMYLHRRLGSDHGSLHVEEVDVMCRRVYDSPDEQTVCALSVKPLALIQR